MSRSMRSPVYRMLTTGVLAGAATLAAAQETKVTIAISGWTGFAPLTLAREAGLFKKQWLDVSIKKIPQKDRHLAIASGDVQCAATSTETWIVWNANGVPTIEYFKMDQGMGADGIVARPGIEKVSDLRGKTIAVSSPGTNPYFTLAWMLKKNGLSLKDVKLTTLEPGPAASAFVAGQNGLDAAVTYEPYLSQVRDKPESGKLIASSIEYPIVFDSFGCSTKFMKENPKAAKGLMEGYFDALDMIAREPAKSFEIMGADVKQTGEQFKKSQSMIRWADRAANRKFFEGELQAFNKDAAALLLEAGVIKAIPALDAIYDASFVRDSRGN